MPTLAGMKNAPPIAPRQSTLALGRKGMIGGLADDPCWGAERIDSRRSVSAQADDADRANTRNCGDSNPEAILFV